MELLWDSGMGSACVVLWLWLLRVSLAWFVWDLLLVLWEYWNYTACVCGITSTTQDLWESIVSGFLHVSSHPSDLTKYPQSGDGLIG